ncbi:hypothetical protein Q674_08490 [Acinetobacter sp. COS3]|uniref:hypothetical protein n=1 Tax=Acinetobacter sp. COS3 TaxID=1397525 RepID=UPI0003B823E4|nr:hypothetical protein [Acinetobacter sp. COS3]ERS03628.1 hypothetical protein Q674_08490 [Acinetobacter sp. COS3]
MKIIGFRSGTKSIRFAILEQSAQEIKCINLDTENEIKIPANISNVADQIEWMNEEIERIFRQNPDIVKAMIKSPEFTNSDTTAKRTTNYFDSILLLNAKKFKKQVSTKLYKQIGVKRVDVKTRAESLCGVTSKKWDEQIADAICVANIGFQ